MLTLFPTRSVSRTGTQRLDIYIIGYNDFDIFDKTDPSWPEIDMKWDSKTQVKNSFQIKLHGENFCTQ